MSAHTPGPWALETVPTSAGSCHKIGPFPSAGFRPQVHACVYADGIRLGLDEQSPVAVELLANARLIAAAPDLLKSAMALGCMPEGYCFCSQGRVGDESKVHEPECRDMRAAIAKATGGAK